MSDFQKEINDFMDKVKLKNGHESEFIQAVEEVAEAIIPDLNLSSLILILNK